MIQNIAFLFRATLQILKQFGNVAMFKAISNSRLRHVTKINKQLRYVTGTPTICLRSRKVQQILCSILKNNFFKWDEMEALVQWLLVIPQKMSVTIASLQTQDSRRFGYWLAKEKMKLM